MLRLSIITISYNNLNGLRKTVKSVLNQTWNDFEYIVIDGNSDDGSKNYLAQISNKLNYVVSEPDTGVYNAMNKGLKKATGNYVLFLNSGDHFFNDTVLEKNYKLLNTKDIIYFNLNVVNGKAAYIKEYPEHLSFTYFLQDTLPHPATFIKRDAFYKTAFYLESFKITSDWKFFIDAICRYNLTYRKVNKTLSTFYIGGLSSLKENAKIIFEEKQKVLKAEYSAYVKGTNQAIKDKETVAALRNSKIIKTLVKLGFLNQF